MRCVSSRLRTAAPRFSAASISSAARRCAMDFSLRAVAASMTQRMARVWRRFARSSTGTWYVAPPTRRDLTSTTGLTLSSACCSTAMASTPAAPLFFSLMRSMAPYTIFSAADFLPRSITILMNLANMSFPNLGSGRMVRWGAAALRDMENLLWPLGLFLGTFGAVLGAPLTTIADAGAIERTADRVITHAGEILDAAAADQHHRVLLQIVPFAADVAGDFIAIGEAHAANLA